MFTTDHHMLYIVLDRPQKNFTEHMFKQMTITHTTFRLARTCWASCMQGLGHGEGYERMNMKYLSYT